MMLLLLQFLLCLSQSSSLSNFLMQNQRYVEASPFNTSTLYDGIGLCELNPRVYSCARDLYSRIKWEDGNYAPLWKRSTTDLSCSYFIQQIPTSHHFIHLQIHQDYCKDSFIKDHPSLSGGTSFYVLSQGVYQQACDVYDHFNGYYDVICQLMPYFLSSAPFSESIHQPLIEKYNGCMLITILIDFEHFDAFTEWHFSYSSKYSPLAITLTDRQLFCLSLENSTTSNTIPHELFNSYDGMLGAKKRKRIKLSTDQIEIFRSSDPNISQMINYFNRLENKESVTNGVWQLISLNKHNLEVDDLNFPFLFDLSNMLSFANLSINYHWRWQHDFHYYHEEGRKDHYGILHRKIHRSFKECTHSASSGFEEAPSRNYYFAGESHLRYAWDYLIESIDSDYVAGLEMKHSGGSKMNVHWTMKTFLSQIDDFFHNTCQLAKDQKQSNNTLVLQTGQWDIGFWPLRSMLERHTSKQLINSFSEVLQAKRNNDSSCSHDLSEIIWLDTMLYPYCLQRDRPEESMQDVMTCQFHRSGIDSSAVLALDDYLESRLKQIVSISAGQNDNHTDFLSFHMHKRFHMIQLRQIFYPRLLVVKYVCKNHYLCRTDNRRMKETSSVEGILGVEAIKRVICSVS